MPRLRLCVSPGGAGGRFQDYCHGHSLRSAHGAPPGTGAARGAPDAGRVAAHAAVAWAARRLRTIVTLWIPSAWCSPRRIACPGGGRREIAEAGSLRSFPRPYLRDTHGAARLRRLIIKSPALRPHPAPRWSERIDSGQVRSRVVHFVPSYKKRGAIVKQVSLYVAHDIGYAPGHGVRIARIPDMEGMCGAKVMWAPVALCAAFL